MERLPREEHFHATPLAALRVGGAIHTIGTVHLAFNIWRFSPTLLKLGIYMYMLFFVG